MNGSGQQHQDACLDEDENLHDGQVGVTERFAGVPHLGKPMIMITAYETPRAKSTRADHMPIQRSVLLPPKASVRS
jgi:hypothetical protein